MCIPSPLAPGELLRLCEQRRRQIWDAAGAEGGVELGKPVGGAECGDTGQKGCRKALHIEEGRVGQLRRRDPKSADQELVEPPSMEDTTAPIL